MNKLDKLNENFDWEIHLPKYDRKLTTEEDKKIKAFVHDILSKLPEYNKIGELKKEVQLSSQEAPLTHFDPFSENANPVYMTKDLVIKTNEAKLNQVCYKLLTLLDHDSHSKFKLSDTVPVTRKGKATITPRQDPEENYSIFTNTKNGVEQSYLVLEEEWNKQQKIPIELKENNNELICSINNKDYLLIKLKENNYAIAIIQEEKTIKNQEFSNIDDEEIEETPFNIDDDEIDEFPFNDDEIDETPFIDEGERIDEEEIKDKKNQKNKNQITYTFDKSSGEIDETPFEDDDTSFVGLGISVENNEMKETFLGSSESYNDGEEGRFSLNTSTNILSEEENSYEDKEYTLIYEEGSPYLVETFSFNRLKKEPLESEKDVIVQTRIKNVFTGYKDKMLDLNLSNDELNLFYEHISMDDLIPAILSSCILSTMDGKFGIKESNVLLSLKEPNDPNSDFKLTLIDLDETFPESELTKIINFQGKEETLVTLRLGLLGLPDTRKTLTKEQQKDILDSIKNMDIRRATDYLKSTETLSEKSIQTFKDRMQRMQNFEPDGDWTLEDLCFHVFPYYKEIWNKIGDILPNQQKADIIGFRSIEQIEKRVEYIKNKPITK